jgi:cytochrome c
MKMLKYAAFLATALVALAACVPADAPDTAADAAPERTDADRPEAPAPKYAETTQLIDLVERAAAVVKSQGQEEACSDFKKENGPWRQGDAYIFVNGMQGTFLCSPHSPELEGTEGIDFQDVDGKRPVATMLERVSEEPGAAWVHYKWTRPGDPNRTPVWKSSYVVRVDDQSGKDVMVGSGLYEMETEKLFVVETVDAAADLVERGEDAFATLRDMASPFRYKDVYVFVDDQKGVELVNPTNPELEGTSILDFQDVNGKFVVRDMIAMLRDQDAGWIDYMWPRPGENFPSKKSSYVRKVKVGDDVLYVGAGVYGE